MNQPIDAGLNHEAVQLIARQHSAYEVGFRSVGGTQHQVEDIVRTIKHGYWPLISKRSVVLVEQSEPCKVLSAVICIPFQSLDLELTRNIVQAIRTNDQAMLSSNPTPLTEFMKSEKYPEIVWLLAECDHAALASASTNPEAAKFAQYVAHDKALKAGDQHWDR